MLHGGKEGRDDEAEEDILKGVGKRIGRRNEERTGPVDLPHRSLPLQFFPEGALALVLFEPL